MLSFVVIDRLKARILSVLEKAPQASADPSPRQLIEPDPALLFKFARIMDHVDKAANDKAKAALADAQIASWLDGMRKIVLAP
jgi:hypothetical protein